MFDAIAAVSSLQPPPMSNSTLTVDSGMGAGAGTQLLDHKKMQQDYRAAADKFNQKMDALFASRTQQAGAGEAPHWIQDSINRIDENSNKFQEFMKFDVESINSDSNMYDAAFQMLHKNIYMNFLASETSVLHSVSTKISDVPKQLLEKG